MVDGIQVMADTLVQFELRKCSKCFLMNAFHFRIRLWNLSQDMLCPSLCFSLECFGLAKTHVIYHLCTAILTNMFLRQLA